MLKHDDGTPYSQEDLDNLLEKANKPLAADPSLGEKMFTQGEVDRIVGGRVQEERAKYPGYQEGQTAIARLQEIDDSTKSETEKLAEKLADQQRKNAELVGVNANLAIGHAVRAAAAEAGMDGDVALALADRGEIKFDPDTTQVTGAKEAVEQILTAKPHLKVGPGQAAVNLNPELGTPVPRTALTQAEASMAQNLGLSSDEYGKGKT